VGRKQDKERCPAPQPPQKTTAHQNSLYNQGRCSLTYINLNMSAAHGLVVVWMSILLHGVCQLSSPWGRHQNAHKERMKKRLEAQARKANGVGGCYLQPLIKSHGSATAKFSCSSVPPFSCLSVPSHFRLPEFVVFG